MVDIKIHYTNKQTIHIEFEGEEDRKKSKQITREKGWIDLPIQKKQSSVGEQKEREEKWDYKEMQIKVIKRGKNFLPCKSRNAPCGVAFLQHMSGSQQRGVHLHKKHLFLQNPTNNISGNKMMPMGNHDKLKESKKLIRVAFHIRNSRHKKLKTEPLLMSFMSSSQNQKFKQTRITIGEIVNKIVHTVASQLCEGDGNLFAEQFFSNIVDSQQQHQELQFSSQFIPSQVQQQTMKSISTSSSNSSSSSSTTITSSTTSPQMCSSYNYNKTCNTTSSKPQLTCYYCDPILTSPTKISSHEDVINEIQKRIVITSMSFPNSKSESHITITRQNLNHIMQLQDMQHVSVYLMPLPVCFYKSILAITSSTTLSTLPSTGLSSSSCHEEKDSNSLAFEDNNDYNLDLEINQQFYEALPSQNRAYSSESIQDEDVLADAFRKSDILYQQQPNALQLSTRSSSNNEKKQKKDYNSHLSISSSNHNHARLMRGEEDSSQVCIRPNSTYVSQIFSATESLSIHGEEREEIMEESYTYPIKKQKCSQEQKQHLSEFEGLLQKRVKLNQEDPISNINSPCGEQIFNYCHQRKQDNYNSISPSTFQSNLPISSPRAKLAALSSPLPNNSDQDISYEKFLADIAVNSPGQNNKINQLKDQQQQFLLEQELSQQTLIQSEKCLNEEPMRCNKENKFLTNCGGEPNRKLKDQCILSNFNFNQAFNEIPDFLGSDTELMKSTLCQIESSSTHSYKTQQLNFNNQIPLAEQEPRQPQSIQFQQQQTELLFPSQLLISSNDSRKQSTPSTIEQLRDELRAQILLEQPSDRKDKKERYLKKIFQNKKEVKKERMSRINDQNMELILKLDHEISKMDKMKQNESTSSSPYFEDQSTRHTCSLRSHNNPSQKLSNYLKKQIKITRVLRFLDDSALIHPDDMKQRVKINREELEQLCRIIYTLSKSTKFTSKSYSSILEESTKQMNSRYFVNKEEVNLYFQDLLKIFPSWINMEQTNYGQVFQINQCFKYRQVKNFFKQQS